MNDTQLVLSLFPGIGLLDRAFEEEGFCVVRGPDVLWGGDIRRFHPPAGRFDGVIGGPPCQEFSSMQNINRARGRMPSFGNLIPEFERCVAEALPAWFMMENVPAAPSPTVEGYGIHRFIINNRQCRESDGSAATQNRSRKISFGTHGERRILSVDIVVFENETWHPAAIGHGTKWNVDRGRAEGSMSSKAFREIRERQGLPESFDLPPFTVAAKCKAVGNGVPLAMGKALARAVLESTAEARTPLFDQLEVG